MFSHLEYAFPFSPSLPMFNPLFNTVKNVRKQINIAILKWEIRKAPYLGDCSARNSHDEIKDLCNTPVVTEMAQ